MADVAAMAHVAMVLVSAFSRDIANSNLTAAEEYVRSLKFDVLNEIIVCDIMTGTTLADFETVVNSISGLLSPIGFPDYVYQSIVGGKFAEVNEELIRDFRYSKGEAGHFMYGRFATVKPDDATINLAYSVYHLEFKLPPQVIEDTRKNKFLGFTNGTEVWRETRDRNFSANEQDWLRIYFLNKAVKSFKEEYASLLEGSTQDHVTGEL